MLKELKYIVNGQTLTGESFKMASDTVNEIKVSFAFEGTDWSGLDSIKAVFSNNRVPNSYEAVLVNGTCTIPHEVLAEKGTVSVNLYGSIISGTTLTTRITSYKSACVDVLQKVGTNGSNSVAPTPATWQQELSAHTQNSNVHVTASEKQAWNAKADTEDIPTTLAELEGDATHRTVTDVEKTTWNGKLSDAPSDGKTYGRKNGSWAEVTGGGSSDVYLVIYDEPGSTSSAYADVLAAANAGKKLIGKAIYESYYTYAGDVKFEDDAFSFTINDISNTSLYKTTYTLTSSGWGEEETPYYSNFMLISGLETLEELEEIGAIPYIAGDELGYGPIFMVDHVHEESMTFQGVREDDGELKTITIVLTASGMGEPVEKTYPQLPTIVNDRYLHTTEQGTLEWGDLSGKEDKSNKVTSFGATPSDDKYPSEKLVKDSLDAKAELPTIVNDRYLHTNASTGNLEWAEGGGGGGNLDLSIVGGKLCVTYEEA